MASSSSMASPASAPCPRYDVFLNHRGPDVKATFAKDLYHRLTCSGLQVFLDDPEMKVGCDIFPQIEAAIGVASVHVAIFSPRYAESKWCLEELVLMVTSMESRAAVILPVFYNVNPSELQYAGRYTEALRIHEEKKRYDLQTIQKWRDALCRVAKISGFDLDAFKGNNEELLEKVIETVREKVPKPPLYVAKFPTGLEEKMQELQTTVLSHEEGSPEAKVMGIVGAGGIGKTTLAKEYFNRHRSEYGASSFLFNVRENGARNYLHSLQIDLLKHLKGVPIEIKHWNEGIGQLKENLKDDKVLVILDDVDHLDQLRAFLPIKDVVHPSSLILFTSRDKGLLIRARIAESSIYHLRGLNRIHSLQLFCSHAFSQLDPLPKYENFVDGFLKACDGLPLSLELIGSRLYGEDDLCLWQQELDGLSQTLPADIDAVIRISYDSLREQEQQIFLDIACFAIGEDMDKWIKIWNGSGWQGLSGFRNLQYKCLVDVRTPPLEQCLPYDYILVGSSFVSFDFSTDIFCEDKEIRMHDHLRDWGRHIASRLTAHRVWNSGERLRDLLEESTSVNPEVRGICSKELLSLNEAGDEVSRIRKLQLMDTQGYYVERILRSVRSPKLVWLRWKECPFDSLPSWIPMRDLRVLEVSGERLERLWGEQQAPVQLEELIIDAPLLEFPKSIGQLKHLQKIVLQNAVLQNVLPCPQLPSGLLEDVVLRPQQQGAFLRTALPEEFYDLRSLKYLILKYCKSFTDFGDLGKLTNLQHIDLYGCKNLNYLPNSLGNLSNLQYLSLPWCNRLNYLPDSLEKLSNLQYLDLAECESLLNLTYSLGNLSNLQFLRLSHCNELKMLPDSLWNLRNLRGLYITDCKKLETLPDSSKMLSTNIREINLSGCESLKMLPNSLGSLINLRHISLMYCSNLETLPDSFENLTNLLKIHLRACCRLKRIPNSLRHMNLEVIYLGYCTSLEMLPDSFGNLTSLLEIDLSECTNLKMLPNSFGNLTSLQKIYLSGCTSLEMLPDSFGNLTSLQEIALDGCTRLKMLPTSFWNLPELEHLHLSSSWNIPSETLGNITSLECKYDEEIYCLKMNPLLRQDARQPCVERMTLQVTNMKEPPSDIIAGLSNLKFLNLRSPSLEVLPPSFGYQKSLKELCLYGCQKLLCLPESVGLLTQLTYLNIGKCGIQSLPSAVMKLNNLEKLEIWRCPLRELPFKKEDEGVEGDTALLPESSRAKRVKLNELDSSSAEKGMMVKLKQLRLFKTEIREISFPEGVCPNLRNLTIIACNALRKIGGLDGLVELHRLWIEGCPIEVDELLLPAQTLDMLWIEGCPIEVDELLLPAQTLDELILPAQTLEYQVLERDAELDTLVDSSEEERDAELDTLVDSSEEERDAELDTFVDSSKEESDAEPDTYLGICEFRMPSRCDYWQEW